MENNKLLAIRDTILLLLSQWELDADECRKVLQMCGDEINYIEKRIAIQEVMPCKNGKNELAEKTANAWIFPLGKMSEGQKGHARWGFSAKEEERSLRGEAELNQSRPAFGRDRRSRMEVVESGEDE